MPYLNEHAARLMDPNRFDPNSFRRENDKFGEGIHAIFGKFKGEKAMTLQAIRFDAKKFTAEEARSWLKEHEYEPLEFEEATAEKSMHYFMPLVKVDIAKREVWGIAAIEEPDQSGEIMDYSRSKPHFIAWSESIRKASKGKSLGNVRDSHTTKAIGKVIVLEPNDELKAFRVGVKVVDDNGWEKVIDGVYTGFSIGGKYGDRWPDPIHKGLIRYEAIPTELSLVDVPCIPGATFEVIKADGVVVHRMLSKEKPMTRRERIIQLLKEADKLNDEDLAVLMGKLEQIFNESDDAESNIDGTEEGRAVEEQLESELTSEKVREIVFAVLEELGFVQRVGEQMAMTTNLGDLSKSITGQDAKIVALNKALDEFKSQIIGDLAKLAIQVEELSKRGSTGPVIRELGALAPDTAAALQKAQVMKAILNDIADPLVRQAMQNEITRLEIKALQSNKQ
ncbi:hypothetical protein C4588_04160 [Candidatus Parcubacteria bacterium]|jgi:hypothetical protein|nr:MAG: hypothetical protein C4588_04160 [Candidatus Parcubacteria bacterium]